VREGSQVTICSIFRSKRFQGIVQGNKQQNVTIIYKHVKITTDLAGEDCMELHS